MEIFDGSFQKMWEEIALLKEKIAVRTDEQLKEDFRKVQKKSAGIGANHRWKKESLLRNSDVVDVYRQLLKERKVSLDN
ncbi:Uncharacterised protein [uncultured archaeon]|nr:Uncharacterised protein [uncultured archaeon]